MAISRDDIEAKLQQIESAVDDTRQQVQTRTFAVVVGAVVVIGLVYLLGRRRGRRAKGARIEVFRL
ncbi:MAG: hypothetical protein IIB04_00425 [Acidobacteria bacterium]|nr:hypothetical protein [Acidobacteriota bacterium]